MPLYRVELEYTRKAVVELEAADRQDALEQAASYRQERWDEDLKDHTIKEITKDDLSE